MNKVRFTYTRKGPDLRSIGAWCMVTLARDGKIDDYLAHGGAQEEYERIRSALGAVA